MLQFHQAENVSGSVSDDSVRPSDPSAPLGLFPCGSPGSAKPCNDASDVSTINPHPTVREDLSQSCVPLMDGDSQRQQEKCISVADDGETQTYSQNQSPFVEENPSLAQSPTLQVEVAELNMILGLNSDESELEEGQLPGEWSGSDDSLEESNKNGGKMLEDCSTTYLVGEEGFTVAQIANLTRPQFPLESKFYFPNGSTPDPPTRSSRKSGTAEKKMKKHKKGEGAKKRAREKSAQKYKEKKTQRLKANAVEQSVESPVARLGRGEQPEPQNANSKNVENVSQVPKSQGKSNSKEVVVEEGEITQPTQTSTGILSSLVEAEVGLWTTDDIDDQLVAQMEQDVAVKKKRGPETAERMLKRKIAKRKKRARKEKELGVRKRHPRNTVSKPPVKVLCTHFMKGRCAKGESCPFSHDAVPLTKQEPCKFFMSHSCLKGDECPFSHDLKTFPCKFFHTRGLCYDGEKCLFSHEPITEEEREKLMKRVEKDKERGSSASVLDLPTPNFSISLPAEEDPDPLGWGTATACPSFDGDLQPRSPKPMDAAPDSSGEAAYGNLAETSYFEDNNGEISSSSTVNVAGEMQLQLADHSNHENTFEKLDYLDLQCSSLQHTSVAYTPDAVESNVTSSAAETSTVSLATPILPVQTGGLLVKRMLEPRKSVPSLTQTTGSRKLTVESLLGEVLKH